jgi:4-amino-4-deoxy-L-arabinose transferase-like glycosyltransferase
LAILATNITLHLFLFISQPSLFSTLAVLILTAFLPGALLAEILVGQSAVRPTLEERILYWLGGGFVGLTLVMLAISYLPGGVSAVQTLLIFDAVTLLLLAAYWWQARRFAPAPQTAAPLLPWGERRWLLIGILAILIIAGALRMTNLGYAEFHGDEARAALRAAGVVQGYEDVLMLHKKGPGEILVPTALLAVDGRLNEANARLPFAIAGVASLLAILLLGLRLNGAVAGWTAAFLLTFDGYLVAFSRFVQYQSVVLLLTTLAVYLLYRAYQNPQALRRYLALAALFLATALIFHFDAAAAFIPVAFLWLWIGVRKRASSWPRLLWLTLPALIIGVTILAVFYIPYALHPHFAATRNYLFGSRVAAGGFPYNNLRDVFLRTSLYSSAYYVFLMLGLLWAAMFLAFRRGWNAIAGYALGGIALAVFALAFWQPFPWTATIDRDIYLLIAGLLALIWGAPRLRGEERMLWLWFGLPMLGALFFMARPVTHIHIFFTPWALLAGGVAGTAWNGLRRHMARQPALALAAVTVAAITVILGGYIYRYFDYTKTEVLLNYEEAHPSAYWAPFDSPQSDSLYGFPFANGWKVVGVLYDQGVIAGDFETNQWFDWIPDWYTRGQHRCDSTAEWHFAIDNPEPWSERSAAIRDRLQSEGYRDWGVVMVNERPHMTIYHRGEEETPTGEIRIFELDDYADQFDALADAYLPLSYPAVEPEIGAPLQVNFNNELTLEGYDLDYKTPLHPGDAIRLTLYWRGQQPNLKRYKVFVQAVSSDNVKAAQKDAYSRCNRLPTSEWRPGELLDDVYDIQIFEDAPAGQYQLIVGLYDEETWERLRVVDGAGNPIDDKVHISDLEITEE